MKLNFVDLFSGIGGFRTAAQTAQLPGIVFNAVASSDIDPVCRKFYSAAHQAQFEASIPDVQEIYVGAGREKIKLPQFDILFGGFPCQPFANIGLRGGLADPRGTIFFDVVRILKYYQPTFFILENVQKMRNHERGSTLSAIEEFLSEAGYNVSVWDLCASDYGLPQQRRRLFFCGVLESASKDNHVARPVPIDLNDCQYPTTWHLLERAMPPEHLIPNQTRKTVLTKNDKWQGDMEIDRKIARPLTASMSKWHRANQDNYYSAAYVHSDFNEVWKKVEVDLSSEPIRRITPLEGFRLQGFPDYFEDVRKQQAISNSASFRLIGNAVPVAMARSVIQHFIGHHVCRDAKEITNNISQLKSMAL